MNNREAYEKWWANNGHFAGPKDAWKACAEHYEAVMRRVLVEIYDQNIEAYRGLGGPMACETYMDEVIKRAREEG